MPAAWYTVHLDSAPQGSLGDTAANIASGSLTIDSAYDPDNDGTALVYADSATDAIQTALTGGVVVNLTAVNLPPTTYEFTEGTSSNSTSDQTPFAVTPTATSSTWKVWLEDLTADPAVSDWDYNDFYWTVSVDEVPVVTSDPPQANPDRVVTGLNGAVSISPLANDTSTHGYYLTITQAGADAQRGAVTISEGGRSLVYTPAVGFTGDDTFSYTVANQFGETATATVSVVVYPAPLIVVGGPLDEPQPNGTDTEIALPFTLTRRGELASSTTVEYRVTVLDGPDFTDEVSSQTFTATFAPDSATLDRAFTLSLSTTGRRVRIEVLPPGPGVPPHAIDPTESVFFFQPKERTPPTSATLREDDFETRPEAPPNASDAHAWIGYDQKFVAGRPDFKFTQTGFSMGTYFYDVKVKVETGPSKFVAVFNRNRSGLLRGQDMTDALFAHEKLHLQIAEYVAQKATAGFENALANSAVKISVSANEKPTDAELKEPANAAFKPKTKDLLDLWTFRLARLDAWAQKTYDETAASNHGQNPVGQADWAANYKSLIDAAASQMGW